jgi:hypothetical protein
LKQAVPTIQRSGHRHSALVKLVCRDRRYEPCRLANQAAGRIRRRIAQ